MRHRSVGRMTALVAGCAMLATAGWAFSVPARAATDETAPAWQSLSESGYPEPTPSELQRSVLTYVLEPPIVYLLEGSVKSFASTDTDGATQVISLATDILFTPDRWDLPPTAGTRLTTLLDEIPDGADLVVAGHTDSVVGTVDNQKLSENRARAVANVITDVRPDLVLAVEGHAATQLKAAESGPDEAEARQTNRRVELRYDG